MYTNTEVNATKNTHNGTMQLSDSVWKMWFVQCHYQCKQLKRSPKKFTWHEIQTDGLDWDTSALQSYLSIGRGLNPMSSLNLRNKLLPWLNKSKVQNHMHSAAKYGVSTVLCRVAHPIISAIPCNDLYVGLSLEMSLRFCNKNVSIRSGIIHNSTTFGNKECYISLTADIYLGFFITTSIMNKYLAQSTTFHKRETLRGLKSIHETSGKAACQIVHVPTFKKTRYKK